MHMTIGEVMTAGPFTIGRAQTLAAAHALMREHAVRHLPVLDAGKVVGMVSMRDLYLLETLRDVNPAEVAVEEAMATDLYVVDPSAPVVAVAAHMAEHKLGSVVVASPNGTPLGVFTSVDALHLLARALGGRPVES